MLGLINNLLAARKTRPSSGVEDGEGWVGTYWPAAPAAGGVRVDEATALNLSVVWACVRVLTQSLASPGWGVFRREGQNRFAATDHPADVLLRRRPNPYMTPFGFRETMLMHTLIWGNAFAEIERARDGRPVALWLLMPWDVEIQRRLNGRPRYRQISSDTYLDDREVFHVRNLSADGLVGQGVIERARTSLGLTAATEQFGATFFENGARPSGVLTTPRALGKAAIEKLRDQFSKRQAGLSNAQKPLVLDEDLKWQPESIPPEDAQFLSTRQFQLDEVCRWFGVPPHKVAKLDRATFNNIEHQAIEYVQDSVLPWVRRFEDEADLKLLGTQDVEHYTKIDMTELLRGDYGSRTEGHQKAIMAGWMTRNEARAREDMNPLPGLDEPLQPLNMVAGGGESDASDESGSDQ